MNPMKTSCERECSAGGVMSVDGVACRIRAGDTIASAMLRDGQQDFRSSRSGQPRGVYCAIGICNECLVTVDGTINVRACVTPAEADLEVRTSSGAR